jgi:hypothetical protein
MHMMTRSPELEAMTRDFYAALTSGDVSWIDHHWSRDSAALAIGSEAPEWWIGAQGLASVQGIANALRRSSSIVPGDAIGFEDASTGWVADRAVLVTPQREMAFRLTLVCHKDGADWKIVHMHVSEGVAPRPD